MRFVSVSKADAAMLSAFWNRFAENEIVHKQLSEAEFANLFIEENETTKKFNFAAFDGDKLVGYTCGCYVLGKTVGYVTMVLVDPDYRRQKIGTRLLVLLEDALQQAAEGKIENYDVTFFNPCNMEWVVPGTARHDHPNAPGVDMTSDGYIWIKNCGYRSITIENSFYQPIQKFAFSDAILAKMQEQKAQNIGVEYYDPEKHYDIEGLMADLNSEDWNNHIFGNLKKETPDPILIAYSAKEEDLDEKGRAKVVGFTGPLRVQASGRGFFAGIGVHSGYRKYGLGKVLFSGLCNSLKEMGADYMTLFTGEENPARNIYESAGFKIVHSWSVMRRLVKQHDQYNRTAAKKMLTEE